MYLILLLACLVLFIIGMVIRAIGLSMVRRAEQQMMEMTAERLERIDQHFS